MVNLIPTVIKKAYDKWNVQGFILFSLSLQIILILFAPFRKRTGNVMVIWMIWSTYLLADWAANFAVGLISNSQNNSPIHKDRADILAFWAPFLLLHLGGPDTITAFALEDNALWLRHLVGLLSQVSAAVLVFSQSLPKNKFLVPTILLFLSGTIKYGERTRALFLANLSRFQEFMLKARDPGPNNAKLLEVYSSNKEAKFNTRLEEMPKSNKDYRTASYEDNKNSLDDLKAVEHAYHFFKNFKGLIVDLILSFREREESQLFFQNRNSKDAFKVLAIELNFIYEVLYTKVVVVHSMFGYIVRFISWSAIVAALSIFHSLEKHGFRKIDIEITYTLLFGAIGLETIALFMLTFSDWTAASIHKFKDTIWKDTIDRCFRPLIEYFLTLKKINWEEDRKSCSCLGWARQILFRRWSESLHQYNLIDYSLKERHRKNYFVLIWFYVIDEYLGLKNFYDQMKYVSKTPFTEKLWDFIFDELKKKSSLADDPDTVKRICSARGDWVLLDRDWNSMLMSYVLDVDYDQSLIIWHIATDLCYHNDSHEESKKRREFSKILSDYMLYLLVMQPTMMSSVAGICQKRFHDTCIDAKGFFNRIEAKGIFKKNTKDLETGICQKRFHDTCIDAKGFFNRIKAKGIFKKNTKDLETGQEQEQEKEHKRACSRILEGNTDIERAAMNTSKSVLFDACILAKELQKYESQMRWDLMSEVWVELLSYAASHCSANTHVAQLSKGGELITFVWLLMAQFGIGNQVQINEGRPRAKLVVAK